MDGVEDDYFYSNPLIERVTLSSLKELASKSDYDYIDHIYLPIEEIVKKYDWRLLLIDEKYIVLTHLSTVYININGIDKKIVRNNCHQGVTFKGDDSWLCLPKDRKAEIMKIDPNYQLYGWDYLHDPITRDPITHELIIRRSNDLKIVPYKYMYYDIVNILEKL